MISDGPLNQEEIDALLGGSGQKSEESERNEELQGENPAAGEESAEVLAGTTAEELAGTTVEEEGAAGNAVLEDLTGLEKDALGEVGNISMGSASTTLSMLLNQKVNITSPTVYPTTIENLFNSFDVPYMTIYIQYIEGLSGFNLLMMRLDDAAVLADLMMGGDGTNISEDLTDIGISAAAEAMNQMIGSSSTSMASMFGTTVNISPPETYINRQIGDVDALQNLVQGTVVVASFNMTIGSILNTKIMQVMGIETAREKAKLILGDLALDAGILPDAPTVEDTVAAVEPDSEALGALPDDFLNELVAGTDTGQELPAQKPSSIAGATEQVAAPSRQAATVKAPAGIDQKRLNMILDIPLKVTVLLGRTKWPIKDILGIAPGSVVELDSMVDEPVEILVNGVLVAMGEVVVVNENFGVRIGSIIEPEERLKRLMQRKAL